MTKNVKEMLSEIHYVIQPGATMYHSLEEAKEEAMAMADSKGGNWHVAKVVGVAVVPEAPVWKDLR